MNADELSVSENERLEIIGAGDGDGWLLVCTVDRPQCSDCHVV